MLCAHLSVNKIMIMGLAAAMRPTMSGKCKNNENLIIFRYDFFKTELSFWKGDIAARETLLSDELVGWGAILPRVSALL